MKKAIFFASLGSIFFLSGCLFQAPTSEVSENNIPLDALTEEQPLSVDSQVTPSSEVVEEEAASQDGEEKNILVETPTNGAKLASPFTVSGKARVFEGLIHVDVKKEDGTVLISETTIARNSNVEAFGDFSIGIQFQFSNTTKGTLEVYSISAKDGSKENLVTIPVEFEVL
jgi:hypothetical protein